VRTFSEQPIWIRSAGWGRGLAPPPGPEQAVGPSSVFVRWWCAAVARAGRRNTWARGPSIRRQGGGSLLLHLTNQSVISEPVLVLLLLDNFSAVWDSSGRECKCLGRKGPNCAKARCLRTSSTYFSLLFLYMSRVHTYFEGCHRNCPKTPL